MASRHGTEGGTVWHLDVHQKAFSGCIHLHCPSLCCSLKGCCGSSLAIVMHQVIILAILDVYSSKPQLRDSNDSFTRAFLYRQTTCYNNALTSKSIKMQTLFFTLWSPKKKMCSSKLLQTAPSKPTESHHNNLLYWFFSLDSISTTRPSSLSKLFNYCISLYGAAAYTLTNSLDRRKRKSRKVNRRKKEFFASRPHHSAVGWGNSILHKKEFLFSLILTKKKKYTHTQDDVVGFNKH